MNRRLIRELSKRLQSAERKRKEILEQLRTLKDNNLSKKSYLEWANYSLLLEIEALRSHIGREKMSHCPAYGAIIERTTPVAATTHCCYAFGMETYVLEEMWEEMCYLCSFTYKQKKEATKWWRILHGVKKK
jgi:hypothetical protein